MTGKVELTDRFITRKTIFVSSQKVMMLWRRIAAPLKICLREQVFVSVETSRLHLAWSTDDRNFTDFLVIKTNLSEFCPKCNSPPNFILICFFLCFRLISIILQYSETEEKANQTGLE